MYRLHFPFPLACHMPAFIRLDGLLTVEGVVFYCTVIIVVGSNST